MTEAADDGSHLTHDRIRDQYRRIGDEMVPRSDERRDLDRKIARAGAREPSTRPTL